MIYTPQRRRFVYDTWDNGSRLDGVMVECTLSITHCLRLNLQLHTIDLVRTCRISSFCTVAWQLARFHYWHDASRGPSAIAELLVRGLPGFLHVLLILNVIRKKAAAMRPLATSTVATCLWYCKSCTCTKLHLLLFGLRHFLQHWFGTAPKIKHNRKSFLT